MFGSGAVGNNRYLLFLTDDNEPYPIKNKNLGGEWGESATSVACALPPAWMNQGSCQNRPELDFTEKPGRDEKRCCERCPVRAQCLQYAIDNEHKVGMWGGFTANEIRKGKRIV